MKHPKITPGRGGLPPTSNVPWNTRRERQQRGCVIFSFITMWACAGLCLWGMVDRAWIAAAFMAACAVFWYFLLERERQYLHAMLLNRPRTVQGLTQWIEHPWSNEGNPIYTCECGRLVDMATAEYFPQTTRWARVCECGYGHFIGPSLRMRRILEELPRPKAKR